MVKGLIRWAVISASFRAESGFSLGIDAGKIATVFFAVIDIVVGCRLVARLVLGRDVCG